MLNVHQFDDQAKAVLAGAYQVSQQFSHGMVESTHFCMALLQQTESIIPVLLDRLGVDSAALAARLDELLRAGPAAQNPGDGQRVYVSPSAKWVLSRIAEEAQQFQEATIMPEHLLLALLREQDTALAGVLAEFGVTHDRVRTTIQSLRSGTGQA